MVSPQSSKGPTSDALTLTVLPPVPPLVPEWTVWIGLPGEDPVTSEYGLFIGCGATLTVAIAHAEARLLQLCADLAATEVRA